MSTLQTFIRRARQFGLRRSILVYLVIVVGLVMASELVIERIIVQEAEGHASPLLAALIVAALVGGFVFFLFQGAVEDRERAGIALANSEERFRSLTALSADWFWETDAQNRVSWVAGGHSMLKLFGSSLAYGQRLWEIAGIVTASAALEKHLAHLSGRREFHDLELSRPGEGVEAEFHLISGEPRFDEGGQFVGYRGVGRDISGAKRAERALSGAKDRLEMALGAGALAIWDSDLVTGQIFLSEGWAQILGEGPGEQQRRIGDIQDRIHAHDRETARVAARSATKGETKFFSAEIRLRTASGGWKWVVSSGKVVERDAAGRATRMSGTIVDIDRRKRAEHSMRDAEARYRTLVDLSPDAILLQSDGWIEYANRAAADMFGVAGPAALAGRETMTLVHANDYEDVLERARYLRAGPGKSEFRERRMQRPDGSTIMVEAASVSYLERGRLVVQTVLRDISEKVRAREELAEREQRFRDVVEAAGEYVWETDAEFRYTWLSGRIEAVLGYAQLDLLGRRPQEFMPLGEADEIEQRLLGHSQRAEPFRDLVHRSITRSGRVIWQSMTGVPVFGANGALKGFRGTGTDITSKRQAEDRIQFLATRDALTGLPNRLLLSDRAGQAILNAGRNKGRIAVLSFHLDRWRLINDSLGHRAGDAVIRAASERMARTLRKDDTLARLGGDEFVLLWNGTRGIEDAALVAQKVLGVLSEPIVFEGRSLNVSASIGISVYPGDGADFDELLRSADAARIAAREAGGDTSRFFSRDHNTRAVDRLEMESDLRHAIARDQLELFFQPVVRGARIVGAEVRPYWRHPQKGLLPPESFMPLAEQAGLMGALATRLVGVVGERIAGWDGPGIKELWFALNVPMKELRRDRILADAIESALRVNRIPGSRLCLELADDGMQTEGGDTLGTLQSLRALGVSLTVDEVGTGQFNLAALSRMPLGKLKIAAGLVADLASREDGAVIVQTLGAMAKGLGLAFAAEGVQSAEQLERLQSLGCDEWQGGLFSEPVDAPAFERLVAAAPLAKSA